MWSELTGLIAPHSHILPIFPDLSNVFPSLRQKKRQKIQHRISQNHSKQCLFRVIWSLNCILIGLNIVHILKCLKALQSKRTEHLVLFRYFLSNRCDTKMVGGGGVAYWVICNLLSYVPQLFQRFCTQIPQKRSPQPTSHTTPLPNSCKTTTLPTLWVRKPYNISAQILSINLWNKQLPLGLL